MVLDLTPDPKEIEMSEINIEELERLAKAAAPGPWRRQDFHSSGQKNGVDDSDGMLFASYSSLRPKSFDFIAAANLRRLALITRVKAGAQQAGPARLTDVMWWISLSMEYDLRHRMPT